MPLKYGYWQWLDELSMSACGLQLPAYSTYMLEQNALLGAKLLAYLTYSYSSAGMAKADEATLLDVVIAS